MKTAKPRLTGMLLRAACLFFFMYAQMRIGLLRIITYKRSCHFCLVSLLILTRYLRMESNYCFESLVPE